MIRFVLFDLDNTLIDRQHAFVEWARCFAASRGLGNEAVDVLCDADRDGFATRESVFEAARAHFRLTQSLDDLIGEYRRTYPSFIEQNEVVIEGLRGLRRSGLRIGIVTNGPSSQANKVQRAGLAPLVDSVTISDTFGVEKPDSRIFAEAIFRTCGEDARPETGWMVGDSAHHDIVGAHRFGLRTLWITRGRPWLENALAPEEMAPDICTAIDFISRQPCFPAHRRAEPPLR